jgi:hypothetical protein
MANRHKQKDQKISGDRSPENSGLTNILSWKGYFLLGSLLLMIFCWMIPSWLNYELNTLQNSTMRPIAEALFMRRIDWIQSAGIVLGSICMFLAIINYFFNRSFRKLHGTRGGSNINFFSRLITKFID